MGYLVGIIGLISAKYPVFRVSLYSTTTLFWRVSSMFFWGPRHEPWKAVLDVKIQLTVVTIVRDSRLDFMTKNHALYVHFTRYFGPMQAQEPKVPFETCMSVFGSNEDAHVHFIRYLGLLRLHQPKVPLFVHRGSARSRRASMQNETIRLSERLCSMQRRSYTFH